jgi:aldose 1-epimerase
MQRPHRLRAKLLAAATACIISGGAIAVVAGGAFARGSSSHTGSSHTGKSGGPTISAQGWGTADGKPVTLYKLSDGRGMTVKITNYGGVVQSIWVPDRRGAVKNVALGFASLADYVHDFTATAPAGASGNTYFGGTIGRYANRIANGRFTLDGHTYTLPQNNGPNTLHGGPNAWNTKVWSATTATKPGAVSLILTLTDPDGYNGFPGTVHAQVTFTLSRDHALRISYQATTDKSTVINVTNHSYFNLAGEGSGDIYGQLLRINANRYTPVDANLIPTGALPAVAGTPFDFRALKPIGRDIRQGNQQLVIAHGYDHNWVLNGTGLRLAAVAEDPSSGRVLRTYTTEPGVQFYTGNFLQGDLVGTSGHTYRQSDGFTLETQHFPDSPNHPSFPTTRLDPGHTFTSTTIYKFSTAGRGGRRRG